MPYERVTRHQARAAATTLPVRQPLGVVPPPWGQRHRSGAPDNVSLSRLDTLAGNHRAAQEGHAGTRGRQSERRRRAQMCASDSEACVSFMGQMAMQVITSKPRREALTG